MAANYVPTTRADFNALLSPAKGWTVSSAGRELVLEYRVKSNPRILIRVFTGLDARSGVGRPRGGDAIRIVGILSYSPNPQNGRCLYKATRIHRTENWRDRVRERVTETIVECKLKIAGRGPHRPVKTGSRDPRRVFGGYRAPRNEHDFHAGTD